MTKYDPWVWSGRRDPVGVIHLLGPVAIAVPIVGLVLGPFPQVEDTDSLAGSNAKFQPAGPGPGGEPYQSRPRDDSGSALSVKEAENLLQYHNKARRDVGVEPVKWSRTLAVFAQRWADEVARTGDLSHRPRKGEWKQEFGENMSWGVGGDFGVLTGAERWYDEIKLYEPGTPIPEDFGAFRAGHYTQMVWKDTTDIGAGKATIQLGEKKGWVVIVCNYNPPGNFAGEKPY